MSAFEEMQAAQLAVLLDALDGIPLSDAERSTLRWLAGWKRDAVENIAAVIRRARTLATNPIPPGPSASWGEQVTAAVREVFPPGVATAILGDDAMGPLSYRLMQRCQDTGRSPADVLRGVDADDRDFCARADYPAAFLANRVGGAL
ncbi:MAG: hypothetical protein JO296_16545 [Pseudonocardiales bacterium]|nr:hypothetical protein [Pseudonocardiales bacterium]